MHHFFRFILLYFIVIILPFSLASEEDIPSEAPEGRWDRLTPHLAQGPQAMGRCPESRDSGVGDCLSQLCCWASREAAAQSPPQAGRSL